MKLQALLLPARRSPPRAPTTIASVKSSVPGIQWDAGIPCTPSDNVTRNSRSLPRYLPDFIVVELLVPSFAWAANLRCFRGLRRVER
jgi:hypothetical protein